MGYQNQLKKDGGALIEKTLTKIRYDIPKKILTEACGESYFNHWWHGLPNCYMTETGINFTQLVWMWNLCKVYGMYDYVKLRMANLHDNQTKWDMNKTKEENLVEANFDWIPG